jgi:hypothetical protein
MFPLAAALAVGVLCGQAQSGAAGPANLDLRAGVLVDRIDAQDSEQPLAGGGSDAALGRKSVVKGMLFSALLPGLGEIYAGGRRGYLTGGAMAAADIFASVQYFTNDGKGDDAKKEYQHFARTYYSVARFRTYVADTVAEKSGCDSLKKCWDEFYEEEPCYKQITRLFGMAPEGDEEFYRQIGNDERYIMGWDDWDPYGLENHEDQWTEWNCRGATGIPDKLPSTTAHLEQYRSMRREADDFYSKADRYAWVMVIGRVVSMIDAAILVKIRNNDLAGLGGNPRLSFKADLFGRPNFRVALKMRF